MRIEIRSISNDVAIDVSFQYSRSTPFVLKNLSFHIGKDTVLSILGRNGIGKATFLRYLTTELVNYSGQIEICGKEVRSLSIHELSRYVAIVASNNPCYQNLVVADYLVTGFANKVTHLQSPSKQQYQRAAEVLEQMGQSALLNCRVHELSSGEMQIEKIARAIIRDPSVIIFDEPTSNLDVKNQLIVIDQISSLAEKGYTLITATHNPGQSIELGGMVLMLSETQMVFGRAADVLTADNLQIVHGLSVSVASFHERRFVAFEDVSGRHKLLF